MTELITEINTQMRNTPQLVQIWMGWMTLVFCGSLIFVKKSKAARYVLASMALAMPLVMIIFVFSRSVHLFGIAHLVLWGPLLVYLIKHEIISNEFNIKSSYGLWLSIIVLTIMISLVFDIRDIFLVLAGQK